MPSEYYYDPEYWLHGPDEEEAEIERLKAEAENQLIGEELDEWSRQQDLETEQEWLNQGDESEADYDYPY